MSRIPTLKQRRPVKKSRTVAATVGVTILLLASSYMLLGLEQEEGIEMDGNFSDWDDVSPNIDSPDDQEENYAVNLIDYRVKVDSYTTSFYLETEEPILNGAGYDGDTVRVFMDVDPGAETGYLIRGIHADFLIEVYGINGRVLSSSLYRFDSEYRLAEGRNPRGNADWNGWSPIYSIDASTSENRLEIQVWNLDLNYIGNDYKKVNTRFVFEVNDAFGNEDYSDNIISHHGGITATMEPNVTDDLPEGISTIATITFSSEYDSPVEIDSISFTEDSTVDDSDLGYLHLYADGEEPIASAVMNEGKAIFHLDSFRFVGEQELTLDAEILDANDGKGLYLELVSVISDMGVTFTEESKPVKAYLGPRGQEIIIDGLFEDWRPRYSDETGEVQNPNIDMDQYDAVQADDVSSFYIQVDGTMLAGATIPAVRAIDSPKKGSYVDTYDLKQSNQYDNPLPVNTGEDAIYIFLDTGEGGYNNFSLPFSANYMIEISGQGGEITSTRYKKHIGHSDQWKWKQIYDVEILAAADEKQIEAQMRVLPLDVYFHMVDWHGEKEWSLGTVLFPESPDHSINVEGTRADTWWNTNWAFRSKLTIDSTNIDSTLSNFPVAVILDATNFDFGKAMTSGEDIRFTSTDGATAYDYEIESWDSTNDLAEIWVEIPSVASGSGTEFYMYYGYSSAVDAESPANVWDSNFEMVQHLHEDAKSGGSYDDHLDSTSNDNDGEVSFMGSMDATGHIDGADEFDGTSDRIDCGNDTGLLPAQITIEAWINRDNTGVTETVVSKDLVAQNDDVPYMLRVLSTDKVMFGTYDYSGPFWYEVQSTGTLSASTWYYVAATYDGSNLNVYINGGSPDSTSYSSGLLGTGDNVWIGNRQWLDTQEFDGIIDEVRISGTARSDAWLKASYHSGNDNLITFGGEEHVIIPAHDDINWTNLGAETFDANTDSTDILNAGNRRLQFQVDASHIFFQFYTEATPDEELYTYSVVIDDSGEGTFDFAIATYGSTREVYLYEWSAVNGWDNVNVIALDQGYFSIDAVNDVVQFAIDFTDYTPGGGDEAYAATYDTENNAFEDGGGDWEATNNPTPADASEGDYTSENIIPEFSSLVVPLAGIASIFFIFRRRRWF